VDSEEWIVDNNGKFKDPFVSIVIPAYNCEKTIGKCLDSLLKLDYPQYEILVVDDGSLDRTPDILKSYNNITILRTENKGPSHARNLAVQKAKGDYIAFTDSDCIVDPNWLQELFKGFVSDKVAGVGGDQQSPDDETPFGKDVQDFMKMAGIAGDYMKHHETVVNTTHNPTCNVLYKKSVLLEAGLFDEKLWPGEDVDIDLKIKRKGWLLYYNPRAVVHHYRPKDPSSFCRMMERYGWAQGYLVRKYGSFRLIHLEPLVILFLLAALILPIIFRQIPVAIALVCFLFFLLPFAIFLMKTGSMKKALSYYRFSLMLLWFWNIGMFKGLAGKKR
jgi:glycosyltransferase involved in cell wall biosynthesis